METKKIVMGVISVAVAIVVLMSMIPIFTDAGASEDTFVNEGYFYVDPVEDLTFSWNYDAPSTFNINGETIEWTNTTGFDVSIACSENFFIRVNKTNTEVYWNGPGGNVVANNTNKTLTVTITSGSGSATNTQSTKTWTENSTVYIMSNTGDYVTNEAVMKSASGSVYMLGDSMIFGRGYSTIVGGDSTIYFPVVIDGTIDDGVTPTTINPDISFGSTTINTTEVNGYEGLYLLSDITFDATYGGEDFPLTYNYFVVPAEVTAERSVHASPVEATLIGLIPLLMMVGILLTAIGLFIAKYRKN